MDVARIAEQAQLTLLRAPAVPDVTGAYLVSPNGRRGGDGDTLDHVRTTDLAVLDWDGAAAGAAGQPLELVLGRVQHLYRPSSIAVVAPADAAYPARAALAAATGARLGLLWTSDSSAPDVVARVRDLAENPLVPARRAAALAEVLSGDPGIAPLTDRLARAVAARVVVHTPDGQLAAAAGLVDDAEGMDPVEPPAGDEVLGLNLIHASSVIGRLTVFRDHPLDADEQVIVDSVAGILGLALRVQGVDRAQAGPAQMQFALMLGDDLQAREAAFRRSRRLRLFPPRRMLVAVVEPFAQPVGRAGLERLAAQLDRSLRAADPRAMMIVHEGGLVLLVEARTDIEALVRSFRRVASMPLSVGVSREVGELRSLPGSHREASRAATIGRRLGAANQVTTYEQLGLLRLLYQLPEHERRAYVNEVLGPIAGDDADAADHRRMLRALRATHGNLAEAARQLFVHRNTVRLRVARLETILGPFIDDADRRLAVFVALDLHRLDEESTS